jgi:hypothetical protein
MIQLRRFLLIQALMLWQGGFLFYATFVVPVGTRVLGSAAEQGRITAQVTDSLNLCGVVAMLLMLLDQLSGRNRDRFCVWLGMAMLQTWLFFLHTAMGVHLDSDNRLVRDSSGFYRLHKTYLIGTTVQWLLGLVWVFVTLQRWQVRHVAPIKNRTLPPSR